MKKIETISTDPLVKKIVDVEERQILVDFGTLEEKNFGDYEKRVVESLSEKCGVEDFQTVKGYEDTEKRKDGRIVQFKISKKGKDDWFGWGTLSKNDNDMPTLRLHYRVL